MIKSVEVLDRFGTSRLFLDLLDPSNGYIHTQAGVYLAATGIAVQGIDGIDPGKADLNFLPYAKRDGQQYLSGKRPSRNIRIGLDLNPDYVTTGQRSIGEIRELLDTIVMPLSEVTLRFQTMAGFFVAPEGRQIKAIVESNERQMFAKDGQIVLSFICPDPDFLANNGNPYVANGTSNTVTADVGILGNNPLGQGFVAEFTIPSTLTFVDFLLNDTFAGISRGFRIQPLGGVTLAAGYIVRWSTVPGNKYLRLYNPSPSPNYVSLLPNITTYYNSSQYFWPQLIPTMKSLHISTSASFPFTVSTVNRYGGL